MTAPEDTIQLDFTATAFYSVELSPGEARQLFGLGGTSDQDLPARITAIVTADPSILACDAIANVMILDRETGHALTSVVPLSPPAPARQPD
jgi:hypothetical protein